MLISLPFLSKIWIKISISMWANPWVELGIRGSITTQPTTTITWTARACSCHINRAVMLAAHPQTSTWQAISWHLTRHRCSSWFLLSRTSTTICPPPSTRKRIEWALNLGFRRLMNPKKTARSWAKAPDASTSQKNAAATSTAKTSKTGSSIPKNWIIAAIVARQRVPRRTLPSASATTGKAIPRRNRRSSRARYICLHRMIWSKIKKNSRNLYKVCRQICMSNLLRMTTPWIDTTKWIPKWLIIFLWHIWRVLSPQKMTIKSYFHIIEIQNRWVSDWDHRINNWLITPIKATTNKKWKIFKRKRNCKRFWLNRWYKSKGKTKKKCRNAYFKLSRRINLWISSCRSFRLNTCSSNKSIPSSKPKTKN